MVCSPAGTGLKVVCPPAAGSVKLPWSPPNCHGFAGGAPTTTFLTVSEVGVGSISSTPVRGGRVTVTAPLLSTVYSVPVSLSSITRPGSASIARTAVLDEVPGLMATTASEASRMRVKA